jgi:HD-GYP domain-containing protein (c-di-GMP phosphodiesterase class II)
MVARIPGLEAVALIVRLTHERWDGRGYPDRLATEQIPLASRIVAVAEAYCAMTSRRVHAPALDGGTAARELQALAGTEFDPELVDRLTRIVGGAELRHRAEPEVPHPA